MLLSDVSVKRPVFATVVNLLLVAFGILSFQNLPLREVPDIDPPIVSVETNYPGASAAIVETRVTQIIEDRIAGIESIRSIESTSSDGRSTITIEFGLDRDIDGAANDVRDRVSRILNNLPEEADPPEISKIDSNTEAVMWLNLSSPVMDILQLTDFAERNIVDRLSVVDGVARVQIGGQQRYAIRIYLDRVAMAARNLTVSDVEAALRRENIELPAGELESVDRDYIVRVEREYTEPEAFSRLVVAEGADGHLIRLGEIARVEKGAEREQRAFRGNGENMIGLGIVRQSTANTLEVARGVRAEVARLQKTLPSSVNIFNSFDSSVFIEESINDVFQTLFISIGLVVLVLYLFLGSIRTVLVPAVTVPVCLIATFSVMSFLGLSLNLLTLLALVLGIGLVVDDAIVVLENIYRRVENGQPRLLASYMGARQVGFAVIATTLVLIGVFVPIAFLEGNVGRLFSELAITLSAAVAFSSLVALTLAPVLCSKLLQKVGPKPWLSRKIDAGFEALKAGYGRALHFCFGHRALVLTGFAGTFLVIFGLFNNLSQELAPQEDRGSFFISVRGPEGAGFEYMKDELFKMEQIMKPLWEGEEGQPPEASRVLVRASSGSGFGVVILNHWDERERSATEIMNELRGKFSQLAGIRTFLIMRQSISPGRSRQPVQFVIGGDTYEDLSRFRDIMLREAENNPGLVNVDVDYRETQPQLRVRVNRERAADLGVSILSIGRTLETSLGGRQVTTFIDRGEEYDVVLRYEDADRMSPETVLNTYVRSDRTGELVPLSNVVNLEEGADAGSLNRYNRVRALTISANLAPGYTLGEALSFMENVVAQQMPDAVTVDYKGESREFKEAGSAIYFTYALALLVVFLILAGQFESFIHPLIIIVTVPLAVAGGLLGLYLTDGTLNLYSQIGLVILIGLAAKNGILIVEFANQLRDMGIGVRDALVDACKVRLRPIMMTGLSTAMGSVPLILATGAGSASRETIGVVIFAGVLMATFLTLFVVPVFYDLLAPYTRSPGYEARRLARQEDVAVGKDAKPERNPEDRASEQPAE